MVNPIGMTMRDWTEAVALVLGSYARVPALNKDDWQRWGATMNFEPPLAKLCMPNPYQFKDWRIWAMQVYSALDNVGR